MLGTHDLALFVISGLLLNMAPGPDSLLIMARSATQGWRAGSAAALGIGAGTCVHILAAALGMSALLATSATAFMVVKLIGAAYLLYIGISMLLAMLLSLTELSYRNEMAAMWATGLSPARIIIMLLENHQQADGSVYVPQALRPYLGGLEYLTPTA